jgi:acyl-CoA thioester hydrolase
VGQTQAFVHRLDVRFRDCDSMGHVNNAVFFTFFEQCRLTFWRQATGAASPLSRVIVAHAECDYRAPAHFGDELEIRMQIGELRTSSFVLSYQIVNSTTGQHLADGKTVMVTYDYENGRSIPIPQATRAFLERLRQG